MTKSQREMNKNAPPIDNTRETVKLGSLFSQISCGVSVNGEDRPALPGEPGVLRLSAVNGGVFRPNENKAVVGSEAKRLGTRVQFGTILISRSNTLELVGAAALVDQPVKDLFLPDLLWQAEIGNSNQTDVAWLAQVLASDAVRAEIKAKASGTSSSMKKLSMASFRQIAIRRPPLTEQKAISEVLSAWDRAIGQTSALIAAKEQLKLGLMQQLFGETAHFERQQELKVCHLGDVATETTRRNNSGLGAESVYSVTKANGMIPMPVDTIGNDISRYKLVRPKAFAYNPMRINIGSIARWEGDDEVLVSPDYVVFECGPELDPDYLNHFRRGHVWDSYVKRSGDGSVRVRIYFDHLSRMQIRLPAIQEQRRIAKVLNAATSELALLDKKLTALKEQKRGLMQKLLTGEVRVSDKLLKQAAKS